VVGVKNILEIKGTIGRIVGEEGMGAKLPDYPDEVSPEIQGIRKVPVGFPEEDDLAGADHPGGGSLFPLPDGSQSMTGEAGVVGSLFPAGADAVEDLRSFPGPLGQSPPAAKFGIIRMSADHQDPFSLFLFPCLFSQSALSFIGLSFLGQKTSLSPASLEHAEYTEKAGIFVKIKKGRYAEIFIPSSLTLRTLRPLWEKNCLFFILEFGIENNIGRPRRGVKSKSPSTPIALAFEPGPVYNQPVSAIRGWINPEGNGWTALLLPPNSSNC
jgi:hypothetical protein